MTDDRQQVTRSSIIHLSEKEKSLIGALIVTHGKLAYELLNAAQKIEANVGVIEAVPLEWSDTVDEAREKIRLALERIGTENGVIIFTDMFGGTPSNISLSFLEIDHIEIVTGVNLPMIVKFATMQQQGAKDVATLAHVISEKGSKAIRVASDLLSAERRAGVPS
jgi:PTS system mannose-specific IIA component